MLTRLLLGGLLLIVAVSPLPFGSEQVWAWSAMSVGVGVLICVRGLAICVGLETAPRQPAVLIWATLPLALALAWGFAQTLSQLPEAYHHPIWRSAAQALGIEYTGSVSIDPVTSRGRLLRLLSYLGIFWLAFGFAQDRAHARVALMVIIGAAACFALYGLVVQFSGSNTILWYAKDRSWAHVDVLTSTFANRNSFATYAGIALVCATGLLGQRTSEALRGVEGRSERFRVVLEDLVANSWPMLAAWFVIAAAMLLTESRAGIAATAVAMIALFVVLTARRDASPRVAIGAGIAAIVVIGFLATIGGEGFASRLRQIDTHWPAREAIYDGTISVIEDVSLLGTGLGTFEAIYRPYKVPEFSRIRVVRAHNDYLELAVELGVPAAALFVSSFVLAAIACARGALVRRRDAAFPAIGLAASILVGLHALVDFSLQIPAVAAAYALVLGVASSQAFSSRGLTRNRAAMRVRPAPPDIRDSVGGDSVGTRADESPQHREPDDPDIQ